VDGVLMQLNGKVHGMGIIGIRELRGQDCKLEISEGRFNIRDKRTDRKLRRGKLFRPRARETIVNYKLLKEDRIPIFDFNRIEVAGHICRYYQLHGIARQLSRLKKF
jgi:hypothetical protein